MLENKQVFPQSLMVKLFWVWLLSLSLSFVFFVKPVRAACVQKGCGYFDPTNGISCGSQEMGYKCTGGGDTYYTCDYSSSCVSGFTCVNDVCDAHECDGQLAVDCTYNSGSQAGTHFYQCVDSASCTSSCDQGWASCGGAGCAPTAQKECSGTCPNVYRCLGCHPTTNFTQSGWSSCPGGLACVDDCGGFNSCGACGSGGGVACGGACTQTSQCQAGLSCVGGACDGASCSAGSCPWCTNDAAACAAGGGSLGSGGSACGGLQCCSGAAGGCQADCDPACGQGDGCGGTCNNRDNFFQGCSGLACKPIGYDANGRPFCGPNPQYLPNQSYASTNPCDNPQVYKACYAKLIMTFFDATYSTACSVADIAFAPKISGVEVSMHSNDNNLTKVNSPDLFTGISDLGGQINFDKDGQFPSADDPRPTETYIVDYRADESKFVGDAPRVICDQGSTRGVNGLGEGQFAFRLTKDNNVHPANVTNKVEVGLVRQFGSWFQVEGGNVFGRNGIIDEIPSTCLDADKLDSCGSVPVGGSGTKKSPFQFATPLQLGLKNQKGKIEKTGIVNTAVGTIDLGQAANAVISVTGDNATSGYEGARYDYNYFFSKTARLPKQNWDGNSLPQDAENFLYSSSGDIVLPFDDVRIPLSYKANGQVKTWGDNLVVLLHEGNITIDKNLSVPEGSYLAIIASGKITFAPGVTEADGVFIANVIELASTGDVATDQQFQGNGTFVGWNGVLISRDLGIRNNAMPTARFAFRADFPINAPEALKVPQISWKEVAP